MMAVTTDFASNHTADNPRGQHQASHRQPFTPAATTFALSASAAATATSMRVVTMVAFTLLFFIAFKIRLVGLVFRITRGFRHLISRQQPLAPVQGAAQPGIDQDVWRGL